MTVRINDYGQIDDDGKYECILTGSFEYDYSSKMWRHEVKKIKPKMPLKYLYCEKNLLWQ